MSQIAVNISIPLDEDKCLRRQCPKCRREFKVMVKDEELEEIAKKGLESFMTKEDEKTPDREAAEVQENACPYCGQSSDEWWTDEQRAYIGAHAENIMKRLLNEQLIRPMKHMFGKPSRGPISMEFKGEELRESEPWIPPETNDMKIFALPCCERKMKIVPDWTAKVHCFFCGFPHNP